MGHCKMKKMIMLFFLLLAFSCEDIDEAEGINSLVGTWEMTNLGGYANADCSGTFDNSDWVLASSLGWKVTMKFTSDGKATYTELLFGNTQEITATWDESKSQICQIPLQKGVECFTYKLNDNKFTIDLEPQDNSQGCTQIEYTKE
jgi:hypothetical protein